MFSWLAGVTYKTGRRIVISLVGGTVLLLGIAMLVLPGPAMVVIPIGLAILGVEFAWARRFLRTIKEKGGEALERVGVRKRPPTSGCGPPPTPGPPDPPAAH